MNAPFSLSFEHEFQYRPIPGFAPSQVFPAIPIGLIGPKHAVDTIAVIDTGATCSLFSGLRAPAIGLELSAGKRIHLASLSAISLAFLHRVTLELFGMRISCEVAFSEVPIRRELLGRHDVFSQVRFAFREGLSLGYFDPRP